jgi:two-component system NtrC family sensor kinase
VQLKISHKIIITILMSISFVALVGFFAYRNLVQVRERLRFVEIADDLGNTILEIRRSEKNFFLYHDRQSLLEINDYLQDIGTMVEKMRGEIIRAVGAASFRGFRDGLTAYRRLTEQLMARPEAPPELVNEIRQQGRKLYDFTADVSRRERERISVLIDSSRQILVYSLALFLALGLIQGHFVARRIVVPLAEIERTTQKISQGDFTYIRPVDRSDEIGSLMAAFNRMVKELQERQNALLQAKKLAALGTLTSGVAHEINNPLSNILTSAQILSEELEDGEIAYKRTLLKNIEGQSNKARDIVRNLLEFSRKREFKPEPVAVRELIESTLQLVRSHMRSDIELKTHVPEHIPVIEVDKRRVQQALLNVVLNAIDAMPHGGLLSIEAALTERGDKIQIDIADTGIGIPPEHLPKIFDPFFTSKEVGHGTGLGLSVSYGIIQQHQGTIVPWSRPGEGTSFRIILPIKAKLKASDGEGELPHLSG